jgi:hypothetical protein
MSDYFGSEIGRHYSSEDRQLSDVVHLPKGPIISEEFILGSSIDGEARQRILQSNMPSGWITNPSNPKEDFEFDQKASNMFWFGKEGSSKGDIPYAMVNGWIVPVAGTNNSQDLRNTVQLPPPESSSSSSDVNFVFLEVWKARIEPESDVNKPSSNKIYKYGNVLYGGQNLEQEMNDPRFKVNGSERIQIQYRMRVINGVDPTQNPYGFNSSIKAQGPLDNPLSTSNSSYEYDNMGEEMDDPGLWRAGIENQLNAKKSDVTVESDLKTVDGFVYAVPLCFVFRRSSQTWTISTQSRAYNRNSSMSQADEAEVLPTIELDGDLVKSETDSFTVNISQSSTKFDDTGGLLKIGDEIIDYYSWSGTTIKISNRGAKDTTVLHHDDGSEIHHVSGHPKDLFSDQIVEDDVYDLRHATSFGDWDFDSLLETNFQKLIKGNLKSQWKISTGDVKGVTHWQVDYFSQSSPSSGISNYVEEGDGPDGFRKVFSDAATPQPNNLLVLNSDNSGQFPSSSDQYSLNPDAEIFKYQAGDWRKGDTVRIQLDQFRETFNTSDDEKVKFVHPDEYYVDADYDSIEMWFGSTYEEQSVSELQSPLDSKGSDPHFLVFGEKPDEDLGSGTLTETSATVDYSNSPPVIDPQSVDFSQQPASLGGSIEIGDYLANRDAWIIVRGDTGAADRNGAFKITASDGTGGLEVEDTDGTSSSFTAGSPSGLDWYIRIQKCTESDDEMIVALGNGFGATTSFDDTNMFVSYDLLYHPSRGLSRCPDEMYEIRMDTTDDSYLREKTFENEQDNPSRTKQKFLPAPMEAFPHRRDENPYEDIRDIQDSIEKVWSESYVDRGSKTLLFQPIRETDVELQSQVLDTSVSYGSIANEVGFEADNSSDMIVNVPGHLLPKTGRVDLPFVRGETSSPNPPWGINSTIVQDGVDNEEFVVSHYLSLYDPTNLNSSDYNTVVNLSSVGNGGPNEDALGCRLYDKNGVKGIELPPHFGFARIYGVYEQSNFYNNHINGRGEFAPGSDNNYRQKDSSFNGDNLLREDSHRRSIFITDDNTFVLPMDSIDTSSLSESFEESAFVIEAALFSFREWTDNLVQLHPTSTISGEMNLTMLSNSPAEGSSSMEVISSRVPYQGNVSGTMPASTTNTSNVSYNDYRPKEEAETQSELNSLNGDLNVDEARVENPIRGEILSFMPFATSLGTGRVSGKVELGSYTDVGYLNQSGYPDASKVGTKRQVHSRGLVEMESKEDITKTISDKLTGMTERLPCGLYASDHQFIGEGFYGEQKKFWTDIEAGAEGHGSYRNDRSQDGGLPQDAIILSDGTSSGTSGSITYDNSDNLYRTFRGGSALNEDGGPVLMTGDRVYKSYPFLRDFHTEYLEALENNSFNPSNVDKERIIEKHEKRMQIHGSVMFGVAFLIRTSREEVTDNDIEVNHGQELQMAVMTGSVFGQELSINPLSDEQNREFIDPFIELHPMGTGEGYCAADRFRIPGRPLRTPSRKEEGAQGVDVFKFDD